MTAFNGKELRSIILANLKCDVASLDFVPEFADIVIAGDAVSEKYAKIKSTYAEKIGLKSMDAFMDHHVTTEDVIVKIQELSKRPNMCGIIVQLPLPSHIGTKSVLEAIPIELDVDGISPLYEEMYYGIHNKELPLMPTVSAIMKIMSAYLDNIQNLVITLLGHGKLVGKPLAHLLTLLGYTVHIINKDTDAHTKSLFLAKADIVISAVGTPGIVIGDMVKDGVIVIDAGTSEEGGSIVGDVHSSAYEKALMYTPSPGGVGPVTVACLMENVVHVAKNKKLKSHE